nr:MAG TPA: hypothetical protein [Caudoviricetes sp.]
MRMARVSNYSSDTPRVTRTIHNIEPLSYTVNIFTDKDKTKFVTECEKLIRQSLEYKDYIAFLKQNMDMTSCSFFNNITNENRRFSIHIHHEPFTLFDITLAVTNRFIREKIPLDYFDVSEEVMKVHYQNMVGLIPLSTTVHEIVHDGQLFIPLQAVKGNFVKFFSKYEEDISPDTKAILMAKIKMSKETVVQDSTVLNTRYIYLENPDDDKVEPIEDK